MRPSDPQYRILSPPFDRLEHLCYIPAHDTLLGPNPNRSLHRPSPLTAALMHEWGSARSPLRFAITLPPSVIRVAPFLVQESFFAKRNHFSLLCSVREASCA